MTSQKTDFPGEAPLLSTLDKRSEVLLRIVPVELAGGGSVTQATQIDEWLNILGKRHDITVRRIGVSSPVPGFVDEQVTGIIYPLDRAIQPASTVSGIYQNVCNAITSELYYLYSIGVRHFTAVCCGYTSYGLFALKQAIEKLNVSSEHDPMTGNVTIQDSSFPDVDVLNTQLDEQGYPLTRFYGPAYQSTQYLRVVFTLNGAVPFDVSLSKRSPVGCEPIMTALPYTPRYIVSWQERAMISKIEARKRLECVLPELTKITSSDWVIPLVASGGCWERASIGKWMTEEQYETVERGTLTLINALRCVSEQSDKLIFMPLIRQGADFVLTQQMSAVYSIEQVLSDFRTGVVILPYDTLPQPSFIELITGSDLVVHRTIQTNSFAETIFARVPQVIMTIPAAGYMEAELMARQMSQGLIRYDQEPKEIASELYRILTASDYKKELLTSLWATFSSLYSSPQSNFGNILAQVAGLSLDSSQIHLDSEMYTSVATD
jgi:hypothetical protein